MVFKVKQNFLKTWLCIPCEQSGRNRGIPSDLSDKCKLQSCRKSEKKRENKFEKKKIVFFFSFINFWLWHDKKICPSVVVKYRKVFGCVMWTHSLEIRALCLMKYGQAKCLKIFHIFGTRNHTHSLGEKIKYIARNE